MNHQTAPATGAVERRGPLLRLRDRLQARWPHIRRSLPRDIAIVILVGIAAQFFSVAWVMTDSIHTKLALILKGATVSKGQIAAFAYSGQTIPLYYDDWTTQWRKVFHTNITLDGPRKGDAFTKYVVGVEGDRVEVMDRDVYLTSRTGERRSVGRCKPVTRKGIPLVCTSPQVIPPGMVYVWAPHPDALDSRYAAMGLVPAKAIVGRAIPLW
jgi:conjugal transfer pilin signal peptidase TrbI